MAWGLRPVPARAAPPLYGSVGAVPCRPVPARAAPPLYGSVGAVPCRPVPARAAPTPPTGRATAAADTAEPGWHGCSLAGTAAGSLEGLQQARPILV